VLCLATAYSEDHRVVTVSSTSAALSGVGPGRGKISLLSEFPVKGRGTKGVRGHSFLKGEDCLVVAGVARSPRAMSQGGRAVDLPDELAKRDGSGVVLPASVGTIGEAAGLD
jgi:DNA gyrase subunit A